jgi:membrane protein
LGQGLPERPDRLEQATAVIAANCIRGFARCARRTLANFDRLCRIRNSNSQIDASIMHAHSSHARGRTAERPQDIPRKGWWDIAVRVKKEMTEDNVDIIASGLALYALLAVFPALAAAVSIYGLFASPAMIADHLQQVAAMLPADATRILQQQLSQLAQHSQGSLSFGIVIGIALSLWSARRGMVALMKVTNLAYDEREHRGFFRQLFVSLAFTIGAILGFLAVLLLGVAVPVALSFLPLGALAEGALLVVRWILLFGVAVLGLAVVYRFAPDRHAAQWRWVTPGSIVAATLWLLGSALFSLYARNWGSYGQTYGALGGVVILLMWFYLSGYVVILGAEINSEMERQTEKDTTTGPPQPRGTRGAYSADTVGPSAEEPQNDER